MDSALEDSDHGIAEIREVTDFIKEYDWLIEAHGARFFTRDFESLVPKEWWNALLQLSETQLYLLPCLLEDSFNGLDLDIPDSLLTFLRKCRRFTLPSTPTENALSLLSRPLSAAASVESTKTIGPIAESPFARLFTRSMSPKKSHEVERLADLIYRVSLAHGCRSILDLGCGQGYLMHVLAFYYKLDVLGVDSSELQTKGAQRKAEATQVLLRTWIKKDAALDPKELDFTPVFMTLTCPISTNITMAQLSQLASLEVAATAASSDLSNSSTSSSTISPTTTAPSDIPTSTPSDTASASSSASESSSSANPEASSSNQTGTEPTKQKKAEKKKKYPKKKVVEPFRKPEIHPLLSKDGVILVGLHTCGDLAPTTLRLFHESPTVKAMINVGCCYNLMTEVPCGPSCAVPEATSSSSLAPSTSTNPQELEASVVNQDYTSWKQRAPVPLLPSSHIGGWPLSSICKEVMPKLSRTARVLACQSIAKRPAHAKKEAETQQQETSTGQESQVSTPPSIQPSLSPSSSQEKDEDADLTHSIHMVHRSQVFRAVLQVIYERDYQNQTNNYSGEYSSDYLENFSKYATHILKKQGKDLKLSSEEMEAMWTEIGEKNYKKLVVFDNLRVCLSPVIETLVMKDRLLFLYEQNQAKGVESQHALFPIFDAAISPRNMALLSTKP